MKKNQRPPQNNQPPARPTATSYIETDFDDYDIRSPRMTYRDDLAEDSKSTPTALKTFAWIFTILFFLSAGLMTFLVFRFNVLPTTLRLVLTGVLVGLFLIFLLLAIRGNRKKGAAITALVLAFLFTLVTGAANYYLQAGIRTIQHLSSATMKTNTVSLVVMKNSPILSLADMEGKTVTAPTVTDKETIDAYLNNLHERTAMVLTPQEADSYNASADALYTGEADAMIMSGAMVSSVQESHPNFLEETRIIDSFDLQIETVDVKKDVDTSQTSFNIYISGIDTYGSISSVSNSDVNIVMTVNPNTRQMLLTTIPRDTYMPIAGGGGNRSDKLTHAGIYGVESSIGSIENFLDIPINYYARVNFSSLTRIVDVLGGIEVDNPVAFSTVDYQFPQGTIQLDGAKALSFSRERHNLAGGDFDRGRNQQRVIIGIFKKLMSFDSLTNFQEILDNISDSLQTNMPPEAMMGFANTIMEIGGDWQTDTIAVEGRGNSALRSPLIPDRDIYLMEPYPESVQKVKDQIHSVMQGEQIPGDQKDRY